ncbi:DUF7882 family protein [Agromyces humi]
MGRFIYANVSTAEIDDRTLAHLQVIILRKMEQRQSFPMTLSAPGRMVTAWISPSTPLEFVYFGNRRPALNEAWLVKLEETASSVLGLTIVPEPPAS